jgi:hypothetical protein
MEFESISPEPLVVLVDCHGALVEADEQASDIVRSSAPRAVDRSITDIYTPVYLRAAEPVGYSPGAT